MLQTENLVLSLPGVELAGVTDHIFGQDAENQGAYKPVLSRYWRDPKVPVPPVDFRLTPRGVRQKSAEAYAGVRPLEPPVRGPIFSVAPERFGLQVAPLSG